jgi:putative membrane protein
MLGQGKEPDMEKSANRTGLLRSVSRVLVIWIIQAAFLVFLAWLIPGVNIDGIGTAVIGVAVIGLVNALFWPLLSFVIVPFAVFTLGLAALAMNAVLIRLASSFVDGFEIQDFWAALALALGLTAMNAIVSSLLTINDDSTWFRNVVRRRMRRRAGAVDTDVPGVLFLEIDGLAKPVLEKAVRDGHVPNMAKWLASGSHKLVGWETDLSSQTSASQAGILHGNNHNIPAFRWYERESREIVASSDPKFVAKMEQTISDGNGLLVDNGVSRGNLFSGDAPDVMNTASTILDRSRFHTGDFAAFFLHPFNAAHALLLTLWDIVLEKWQFYKARRNKVYPISDKAKRGGIYPVLRAFSTILMRELNIDTLVGDMFAGVPSGYATFVGYDEVAHHSGVESEDAFDTLKKLDRQFERLETAAREAPRPYHLVVLSDHGQTQGATFKQRYHKTLKDLILELAEEPISVQGDVDVHEDWNQINVFLTETVQYDQAAVSKPLSRALRSRSEEGQVALGPEGPAVTREKATADVTVHADQETAEAVAVLASGNLGVVYSTRRDHRITLEELEALYPRLLDRLAQHEGIGFVMMRSEQHGPIVIGPAGRYYLVDDGVEGENPLAEFGPNAAAHLRRTDSFPDAPDLLINSFFDPEKNEGAAFEELIGFHGGLGGYQTQPFVLYPAEFELGEEELVGAASVYRLFKEWLDQLSGSVGNAA